MEMEQCQTTMRQKKLNSIATTFYENLSNANILIKIFKMAFLRYDIPFIL